VLLLAAEETGLGVCGVDSVPEDSPAGCWWWWWALTVLLDCLEVELGVELTSEFASGDCGWLLLETLEDGLVPLSMSGSLDIWLLGLPLALVSNLQRAK
jgi:hypothetical protein